MASAVIGALMFSIGGVWAMVAPDSFFEVVARYPPYNQHLFHDLSSWLVGAVSWGDN